MNLKLTNKIIQHTNQIINVLYDLFYAVSIGLYMMLVLLQLPSEGVPILLFNVSMNFPAWWGGMVFAMSYILIKTIQLLSLLKINYYS